MLHNPHTPASPLDSSGQLPSNLEDLVVELARQRRGIYLGDDAEARPLFSPQRDQVMVMGGTGSGKTTGFFAPSVASYPGPVVVTSTRRDLMELTRASRQRVASTFEGEGGVYEMDFLNMVRQSPVKRVTWSPLRYADNWEIAWHRAEVLVDATITDTRSNHFSDKAKALVSCILHAAALEGHTLEQAAQNLDGGAFEGYGGTLRKRSPAAYSTWMSIMGAQGAATEERRSIFSTSSRVFNDSRASGRTPGAELGARPLAPTPLPPEINFNKFLRTSSTLYITVPDHMQEQLRPVITLFVDTLIRAWEDVKMTPRRGDPYSMLLALDEVANISPLKRLPSMISQGGGNKIQVAAGFQHPDQALERWGTEEGSSILEMANHKLYLSGVDDVPFMERVVAGASKIMASDNVITVRPGLTVEPGLADRRRLIDERRRLERVRDTAPHHALTARMLTEGAQILTDRLRSGIIVRPEFRKGDGVEPLLNEIEALTEVELVHERRVPVEPSDIIGMSPGTAFRKSLGESTFTDLVPAALHPYWSTIMPAVVHRHHEASR